MDVTARMCASALAAEKHGVITRQDALRCGLTDRVIDQLVRRGVWQRLFSMTYFVDAQYREGVPREAWLSAALQSYGDVACLIGPTAAALHGLNGLPVNRNVIWLGVIAGRSHRGRGCMACTIDGVDADMRVDARQYDLAETDVTTLRGLRVTNLERTIVDTALLVDRVHALSVLDSVLSTTRVSPAELSDLDIRHKGRPGIRRFRELVALADGRAQSPLETRIRLACIDAGMPPDDLQYPVLDHWGRIIGRGDLAWWRGRRRPLIAEADGAQYHDQPGALFRDRHRANDFTLADVDMVRFTWADSVRPAYMISVIRAGLARDAA
jgi:hypothetical protein